VICLQWSMPGRLELPAGWAALEQVRTVVRLDNTDLQIQLGEARLLSTQLTTLVITTRAARSVRPLS